MSFFIVDKKICKKDNLCIKECPMGIIVSDGEGFPTIKPETVCIKCGHCQAICSCDAITLYGVSSKDQPKALSEPLNWDLIHGLIKSRRSIRKYKPDPISPDMLNKLFDVTRWAPTGGNTQLVKWLLVEKPGTIKKISGLVADWSRNNETFKFLAAAFDTGNDVILRAAPHLAIAYAGKEYGSAAIDCMIATTTLELAASSQGIGACWAGFFMIVCAAKYQPLLDFLEIPAENNVHAALMLGYPHYKFNRIPSRKPLKIKKI